MPRASFLPLAVKVGTLPSPGSLSCNVTHDLAHPLWAPGTRCLSVTWCESTGVNQCEASAAAFALSPFPLTQSCLVRSRLTCELINRVKSQTLRGSPPCRPPLSTHSTGHSAGRRAAAGALSTWWPGDQGVSGQSPPISHASWGLSLTLWVGDTNLGLPTSHSGRQVCESEGRGPAFSGNHQLIPVCS